MANKTITQLTAAVTDLQDSDEMEVQVNGETQTRKMTGQQIRAVEKGEREDQDDQIEESAGLNADGTFTPPSNSWLLRAADFAAGCTDRGGATGALDENLLNGLRLLDAAIVNLSGLVLSYAGVTGDTTYSNIIPAGYMLEYVIFEETAGNEAVLDLGTSAGGSEVLINNVVAASDVTTCFVGRMFSSGSDTTLYLNDDDAGSDWNSATVKVYFVLKRIV